MLKKEDEEPDIGPFDFYFDAFQELSSCRVNSMGLGPIPFTASIQYSSLYEIEDQEDFHYLIRTMDNALLSLESKKSKSKGASKDAARNSGKANINKG